MAFPPALDRETPAASADSARGHAALYSKDPLLARKQETAQMGIERWFVARASEGREASLY